MVGPATTLVLSGQTGPVLDSMGACGGRGLAAPGACVRHQVLRCGGYQNGGLTFALILQLPPSIAPLDTP